MDDLRATAHHEAGHAVMVWLCGHRNRKLTIIPEDDTAGYSISGEHGLGAVGGGFLMVDNGRLYIVKDDGSREAQTEEQYWLYNFTTPLELFEPWKQEALIYIAGEIVEIRVEPEKFRPDKVASDRKKVTEAILSANDESDLEIVRGEIREQADNIFDEARIWGLVSALANHVVEVREMSGDETRNFLQKSFADHAI